MPYTCLFIFLVEAWNIYWSKEQSRELHWMDMKMLLVSTVWLNKRLDLWILCKIGKRCGPLHLQCMREWPKSSRIQALGLEVTQQDAASLHFLCISGLMNSKDEFVQGKSRCFYILDLMWLCETLSDENWSGRTRLRKSLWTILQSTRKKKGKGGRTSNFFWAGGQPERRWSCPEKRRKEKAGPISRALVVLRSWTEAPEKQGVSLQQRCISQVIAPFRGQFRSTFFDNIKMSKLETNNQRPTKRERILRLLPKNYCTSAASSKFFFSPNSQESRSLRNEIASFFFQKLVDRIAHALQLMWSFTSLCCDSWQWKRMDLLFAYSSKAENWRPIKQFIFCLVQAARSRWPLLFLQ